MAKDDKNIYYQTRSELGWSREAACQELDGITVERLERIENDKFSPHPEEVKEMSDKYRKPELCNYYCVNECAIGAEYVPEIKMKHVSQIVLETIASLNSLDADKNRLIDIMADGKIGENELRDFVRIQDELERISIAVETLQFWSEKMEDEGIFDKDLCDRYRAELKEETK